MIWASVAVTPGIETDSGQNAAMQRKFLVDFWDFGAIVWIQRNTMHGGRSCTSH